MAIMDWLNARTKNAWNIAPAIGDRLGKTGEWTNHILFGNPANKTWPETGPMGPKGQMVPSNVGPGGMQFMDDAEYKASIPGGTPNFSEQQLKDAGILPPDRFTFGPDSGSSNGYGAAAAIAAMLQQINDQYDRQVGTLNQSKQTSLNGINSAFDTMRANTDRNYADYQGAASASQQAMAQRVAEQLASVQARQAELAGASASMGQNTGALNAQAAGNQEALKASSSFQDALSSRMAQIVSNNQAATRNTGDLVKAGAVGTLENNFNQMLNALMAQKEQNIMSAQSSGGGGGGGGGGEMDFSKMYKQALAKKQLEDLINGTTPQNEEILNSMLRSGGSDALAAMAYLDSRKQQQQQQTQ